MDKIKELVLERLRAGDDVTDIADRFSVAINDAMRQYRTEESARKNDQAKKNAAVEVAAASVEITSQDVEDVLNVGKIIYKAVERD